MPEENRASRLPDENIEETGKQLANKENPLSQRFRALFGLKSNGNDQCVEWIGKCFNDDSALLKHELAYCLGQMRNKSAIGILSSVLRDKNQEPMVRHEAGEALGAIGDISAKPILEEHCKDEVEEVAETCQLALQRLTHELESGDNTASPFDCIDPTSTHESSDIELLRTVLVDEKKPLWERYSSMFKLRNINTDESIKALSSGLYCEDSALFRHEVAFVLGQVASAVAIDALKDRLLLDSENCMVRHECAEALGSIGTNECIDILKVYAKDNERVVRESCEVALDIAEYENNKEFQYAKANC